MSVCQECGLPIKACNRIAVLEHNVQTLALALLQLGRDAARTWDYDGETMTAQGVNIERQKAVEAVAGLSR